MNLLASQSIPSWNQIIGWLREMETLRKAASSYAGGSGLVLVFRRMRPPASNDRRTNGEYFPARVYHGLDEIEMDYE